MLSGHMLCRLVRPFRGWPCSLTHSGGLPRRPASTYTAWGFGGFVAVGVGGLLSARRKICLGPWSCSLLSYGALAHILCGVAQDKQRALLGSSHRLPNAPATRVAPCGLEVCAAVALALLVSSLIAPCSLQGVGHFPTTCTNPVFDSLGLNVARSFDRGSGHPPRSTIAGLSYPIILKLPVSPDAGRARLHCACPRRAPAAPLRIPSPACRACTRTTETQGNLGTCASVQGVRCYGT